VLKRKSDDILIKQCKQVALIQLREFKKALELIEQTDQQESERNAHFQKAYCLYRLNRCEDVLQCLDSSVDIGNQVLAMHLRAQTFYKMGKYDKAAQTYEQLEKVLNNLPSIERGKYSHDEFLTNLSASHAMEHDFENALKTCDRGDTYELLYNASCAYIGLKKYDQALQSLKESERLCRKMAEEEEMTEEELNNELAAIIVQIAYVKQITGDLDGALQIYEDILKNKPSDKVAIAVAANNLLALHSVRQDKEGSLFDVWKKLKLATQDQVWDRLTTEQKRGVDLNIALLHLHMNKLTEARQEIERISKSLADSDIPVLLRATLYLKEKRAKEAIDILEKYITENKNAERVKLSLAQIRLNRGEWSEAAKLLQNTSISTEPSIVRLLIDLYQKCNDTKSSLAVLNNAMEYYQRQYETKKDAEIKEKLVNICLISARIQEEQRKHKEAAQTYKMLAELDTKRKLEFNAKMVNALTFFDMEEAEKSLAQLPAIPISHLNVDELEANETNPFSDYQKVKPATATKPDVGIEQKKKKKKKRKNKPPKNPNAPIDPNRWVSKKKKKAAQVKATGFGTQGSDKVNQALQHEKGHKTIHKLEQAPALRNLPKGIVSKKKKSKK
jgi:signal recognition particle subunit SRP72